MAKIVFITSDGAATVIEDAEGTLMEIATAHGIDGIDGACGGVCSCATCHVKVRPEWLEKTGPPGETEKDLLEFERGTDERSRLCCQIEMCADLDGLTVEVVPLG
jgi:2Fe-2S ferredoxin